MKVKGPTGWQLVETDAGFHVRLVARNHEVIMASKPYPNRRGAKRASAIAWESPPRPEYIDERLHKVARPALPDPGSLSA